MTNERGETSKLLAKREKEKRKKPKFQRQESWRYKRLKENWRRPRGLDSKMRKKVKGWPASPNSGYRGLKKARGLHPSGFKEVMVFNLDDLNSVDPKIEAIRIAHRVGDRKRIEIVNKAKEMGIHILNPREYKELESVAERKES
ncbi:MAG: 50S ribosomal protein L32e [Candidatus Bathyarchaeia archaeon]